MTAEDLLLNVVVVEPAMNGAGPTEATGRLEVLTAGNHPSARVGMLTPEVLGELIERLNKRADFVVFDSPPLLAADALPLAIRSDNVLVVARSGRTTRDEAESVVSTLQELESSASAVVLTDARRDGGFDEMPTMPPGRACSRAASSVGPIAWASRRSASERPSHPGDGRIPQTLLSRPLRASLFGAALSLAVFGLLAVAVWDGGGGFRWDASVAAFVADIVPVSDEDVHVDPAITALTVAAFGVLCLVVVLLLLQRRLRAAFFPLAAVGLLQRS